MGRKGVTWLETPKMSPKRSFSLLKSNKRGRRSWPGVEVAGLGPVLEQGQTSLWFLMQRSAGAIACLTLGLRFL